MQSWKKANFTSFQSLWALLFGCLTAMARVISEFLNRNGTVLILNLNLLAEEHITLTFVVCEQLVRRYFETIFLKFSITLYSSLMVLTLISLIFFNWHPVERKFIYISMDHRLYFTINTSGIFCYKIKFWFVYFCVHFEDPSHSHPLCISISVSIFFSLHMKIYMHIPTFYTL